MSGRLWQVVIPAPLRRTFVYEIPEGQNSIDYSIAIDPNPGRSWRVSYNCNETATPLCSKTDDLGYYDAVSMKIVADENSAEPLAGAVSHSNISHQFKQRSVQKTYLALVIGSMPDSQGAIELPIGRHPLDRKRMSTVSHRTRRAETHWRVLEPFSGCSLLEVDLKTGRTHQIRVHCAAIHHPIIGDPVYGPKRRKYPTGAYGLSKTVADILAGAQRQMLHAWKLTCIHPTTGELLTYESAIPDDMSRLLEALRKCA